MASARYTLNIRPEDLEPDKPRELTKKEKAPAFPQGENRGRCAFTPCYAGGRLLPAAFRAAYCTTER